MSTFPMLLGMVTLVFLVLRVLPGDPIAVLAAQSGGSAADVARLRAEYGLDRPLGVQYVLYLLNLARGNLGRSLYTGQTVSQLIAQQVPATLALTGAAMLVAVGLGLPLGIVAAQRRGTWIDSLCMDLAVVGVSVPIVLSGLVMILVFGLALRWLPATGQGTLGHLVMPAAVMGLSSAGSIARLVRAHLGEVLDEQFISVGRAKGLSEGVLLVRYALRNVLPPVLTLIGLQFGFMLSGAVVTESIFARQGLGRTLVDAILYQDYPVVQGVVLVSAGIYTGINLTVDLAHGFLDPRIVYE
ncbi:MAG: ABC transporter permease [Anaerolineae bacterium]|nr:ABC transporter permease [Anaerolineae bacterium]